AARVCALAAVFALAPAAARAQDCKFPGEEEYATAPVCNLEPELHLTPQADVSSSQPAVPVTIVASDHYSDNDFASFRIVVGETDVTSQWNVVVTEMSTGSAAGTGRSKTFTARGRVVLSDTLVQRTLLVELCDVQYCTTANRTFKLLRPGVEVGADGGAAVVLPAATRTTPFTVKNTGMAAATFALWAECRDAQGQAITPCSVAQATLPLAAGATGSVAATYPAAQQGGMVTVMVRARQTDAPGIEDAGWTDVTIGSPAGNTASAPQVTLVPLNEGAVVERSQCVTVAAAGGAYECGDLRMAHALPAHRTRGRTWAPVLLYNSNQAHPRGTVRADVTIPAGAPVPNTVEMVVRLADGVTHRASFAGSGFVPGTPRRIGVQWDAIFLGTGLYGYHVQVISHYGGGPVATPEYPGELAIVNRLQSPWGAGWWLAGLERLYCVNCATGGSRTLWVGGDGSTRVYEPVVPGGWSKWVATNPDGPPDTLELTPQGYVRTLPGGGHVYYDDAGRQTLTENRLGQRTRFTYGSHGLAGVYVPGAGAGGPGTGDPAWAMNWDAGALLVRSISATLQGGPTRTTSLGIDTDRRVTMITDPDGKSVGFGYHGAAPWRIASRRDRRQTESFYGYGAAGKLESARIQMGTAPDLTVDPTMGFVAAEARGVAHQGATLTVSADARLAYTRLDGPRTDVSDLTLLWLSSTGAVRRVRDAMGGETYLQFDPIFPALATRSLTSTGRQTRAHYDARGRVDTATMVNVVGDGRDHATVYAYDDRWDAPTAVTSYQVWPGSSWTPLGGTARAAYDTATGNVLWRQLGDDAGRRVNFRYHTSGAAAGQLSSVRAPSGVPGQEARDSLLYDTRGNLRLTVSPLGFLTLHHRDALGRDTLTVTPTTAAGATTEAGLMGSGMRRHATYSVMDQVLRTRAIGPAMAHNDATGSLVPWNSGSDTLFVMTEYDDGGLPLQVLRWASPDTARVHVLTTTYTYDRAGRKETETDGSVTHRYAYDPAGNVHTWTTPRGYPVKSTYDALGRILRRTVPAVTYARECPSQTLPCQDVFPRYSNAADGALEIAEERTTYRYDAMGNMVRAENGDALVARSYHPNGALRTDSLSIRSLNGPELTHHYGLTYGYTLSGQVSGIQHPTNLAGTQAWDQFGYHPVTGALSALSDRLGHVFEFRQNYAGQTTSLHGPSYTDSSRYDLEGRLLERRESAVHAGMLHHDSLVYDARGKLLRVNVGATNGRGGSTYRQWYSGSGMLVATDWRNEMDAGKVQEVFAMDALGNTAWRRTGDGSNTSTDSLFRSGYEPGLGRLQVLDKLNMGPLSSSFSPERTVREYDASGNVKWSVFEQSGDLNIAWGVVRHKRGRSYYGADERLRYFQERDLRGGTTPKEDGVWEEYRYDPLGRRVMVNARTQGLCNTGTAFQCASATTRMVWAGDQLLWEIRGPSESPGEAAGPSDAYGTVGYAHAGGIDRPLVITKNGVSVLPHQNWRGQFSRGTWANGNASDCPNSSATNCVNIPWPGWRTTAWHAEVKERDIRAWWGGLVDGMRDASGQMYMRNRYYDPATGQFTQQDPIGIAGGLNSYGFAAGDPVTYSDPYGLTPCWILNPSKCVSLAENLRREMARHGHNITSLEAEYYVKNPGVMLAAAWAVRRSSQFADQMARKYPGRAGVANAARHQYGQCYMTQLVGEEAAATTAELHEAGATDQEDSQRDQANNRVGRAMGRRGVRANCAAEVEANMASGNYDWEAGSAGQYLNPHQ
ncbi:MAG TPA: RHS repeat-associated core domain-containing protein, partial [Longimicrobium sp.]|nr:RHS repeat-associated core domain-containing protein [Longimicrobium sp.]